MSFTKPFGEGIVIGFDKNDGGNTYVRVKFSSKESPFGFPGAFYDGFLKVKE